jgi:hypothetical protein
VIGKIRLYDAYDRFLRQPVYFCHQVIDAFFVLNAERPVKVGPDQLAGCSYGFKQCVFVVQVDRELIN